MHHQLKIQFCSFTKGVRDHQLNNHKQEEYQGADGKRKLS